MEFMLGCPIVEKGRRILSEANTVQGGVELAGKFSDLGGNAAVTEAFDEPLTMAEVNAIAGTFIVPKES